MRATKNYFRIHTKDQAYKTQRPRGLFTAIDKLVDENLLSDEELEQYGKKKLWFEANLPIPPFYEDGNSIQAITWYKNSVQGIKMFSRMDFYLTMAEKYQLPLFITQTDNVPGEIIYEDEYQIGVVNSSHSGEGFETKSYDSIQGIIRIEI